MCRAEIGRSRIAIASSREQFRVAEAALAGWRACSACLRSSRHQDGVLSKRRLRGNPGQQGDMRSRVTSCNRDGYVRPRTAEPTAAAATARATASAAQGSAVLDAPLHERRAVATGAYTARCGAAVAAEPCEGSDEAAAAVIHACCTVTRDEAKHIIRPGGRMGQRGGKPVIKRAAKAAAGVEGREVCGQRRSGEAAMAQAGREHYMDGRGRCADGGPAVTTKMPRGNKKSARARGGLLPGPVRAGGGGGVAAAAEVLGGSGCADRVEMDAGASGKGEACAEAEAAREAQHVRRHSAVLALKTISRHTISHAHAIRTFGRFV